MKDYHKLTEEENKAIDAALMESDKGEVYSHDEVMIEAKDKFQHLKFK